jgi:hypothetical protein
LIEVTEPSVVWAPPTVVEYAKVIGADAGVPTTELTVAVNKIGWPKGAVAGFAEIAVVVMAAVTVTGTGGVDVEPAFAASPL